MMMIDDCFKKDYFFPIITSIQTVHSFAIRVTIMYERYFEVYVYNVHELHIIVHSCIHLVLY